VIDLYLLILFVGVAATLALVALDVSKKLKEAITRVTLLETINTSLREANNRLPFGLQESGLHMLIGEMKAPIYKAFAKFRADHSCEVSHYSIAAGNRILETRPFAAGPIAMCDGDDLFVTLETKFPCLNGGESPSSLLDAHSSPSS
jgi:hypothetical protein